MVEKNILHQRMNLTIKKVRLLITILDIPFTMALIKVGCSSIAAFASLSVAVKLPISQPRKVEPKMVYLSLFLFWH